MKSCSWLLVSLAAIALPAALPADDAAPKAQPALVYEPMAGRSPFMAPTAPAPVATPAPVQAGPHWWDQMVITSLMEAGGVYIAAVVDKANNKRYVLESGKTDEDSHLLLAEVQWNDRANQSTVTVRKGAEVAPPLRFDASAPVSAPAGTPAPFNPARNPTSLPGNLPLPPRFTGAPPPPPPQPSVVHHSGPIASRPSAPGGQGAGTLPSPPPQPQRRTIRPLSSNTDLEN